jgi:hypothetical protein
MNTSAVFQKDFMAYYLPARALFSGGNIYDPLPVLADKYEPRAGHHFEHPTPYPPIAIIALSPLSLLRYEYAVSIWSTLEFTSFVITGLLLLRHFGGRKAPTPVILTLLLVVPWRPIFTDLYVGQMMMFLGLLLILAWLSLRSDRKLVAGLLLGAVLALKFYGWPILVLLLLRKRFTTVAAALSVFVAANLFGIAVVGLPTVIEYYSRISPAISSIYREDPFNFSLAGVGFRLGGSWFALVLTMFGLLASLALALRSSRDCAYIIMLTASIILAPIAWFHYLVTLVPALCFIAARTNIQKKELIVATLIIVAVIFGFETYAHQYSAFATWPPLALVLVSIWMLRPSVFVTETDNSQNQTAFHQRLLNTKAISS